MPSPSLVFRSSSLAIARWVRRRPASLVAAMGVTAGVATLGGLGSSGCIGACTDAGCFGGFEVVVTGREPAFDPDQPFVDTRLRAAVYRVEARVDGGTLEVECTFDDQGEGTCEEEVWLAPPARGLDTLVFVTRADREGELWGEGIQITFVGSSHAHWGNNSYGPDMVDITVTRDGVEAASASYVPEYELHEDLGGKGCGDCEVAPAERLFVDPA